MKNIKIGVLSAFLFLIFLSHGLTTHANEEDYIWITDANDKVRIIDYIGNDTEVVIPNQLGDRPVSKINAYAFANRDLVSVSIPESVTEIGEYAFSLNQLTSVDLPDNMSIIEEGVFAENLLKSIEIPDSVTQIEGYAFMSNELEHVSLSNSLEKIGEMAFSENKISHIPLPNTLETIDKWAFGINGLSTIEIPQSVRSIGEYAFVDNQLTNVILPTSLTNIEEGVFLDNQLTEIEIPSNVTKIGGWAFSDNRLTKIEVPKSVTTIEERAFSINQISAVKVLSDATMILDYAFDQNPANLTIYGHNTSTAQAYAAKHNHLFEFLTYKVTYNGNGSTGGSTPVDNNMYQKNTLVTVLDNIGSLKKTGYIFKGWNNKPAGDGFDYVPNNTIEIKDSDIELFAIWVPHTYNITFNVNDGTNDFSQTVEYNQKISEPNEPTRLGYTFVGWYKEKHFITLWDFDNELVTEDIILYAKWVADTYEVTFDADGGSFIKPKYVTYDTSVIEPTAPLKDKFTFAGWFKDEARTIPWDFGKDSVKGNLTLYAKWIVNTPNMYEVTFNTNGGSSTNSQLVTYDTVIIEPSEPSKEGYTFAGWYKDESLTTPWHFEKDVVKGNTTLYAKWTTNTYEVTFETNGGTAIEKKLIQYNQKILELAPPSRSGYTFIGWYKEATFENEWQFKTDVVTTNITLYAKWQMRESSGGSSGGGRDDDDDRNSDGSGGGGGINSTPTPEKPAPEQPEPVPVEPQPEQPEKEIVFVDVPREHWAWTPIQVMAKRGIITGYLDGTFKPNAPIQRQHVALILTRALEFTPQREAKVFNDIPDTHPYFEAITKVQQAGIFSSDKGNFNPTANMTRAQMAKVLVSAFNLTSFKNLTFKDVPASHWAYNDIAILAANGITTGDHGYFKPQEPVTRAQFAAFLYRALQQFEEH